MFPLALFSASGDNVHTLFLSIPIVNSEGKCLPESLLRAKLDSGKLLSQFDRLIDALAPLLNGRIR
ncbi:MAG: hypothetical protein WBD31_08675 [Rubripirellula sp.]